MIEVCEIGPKECWVWNEFVLTHPRGTCFHIYEWKLVIEKAYRLPTFYLGAFDKGQLVAVLPAVVIKRPFGERCAVSLAFCGYAGWLIQSGLHEDDVGKNFLSYLKKHGISTLELRKLNASQGIESEEATLQLNLPKVSEILWNQLDSSVRRKVRKAEKSGLASCWGLDQLDDFYRVYSRNMAHLGTPVHSKKFFEELSRLLSDRLAILTVRKNDLAVAAMVLVKFREQLSFPWASSLHQYNSLYSNMLLYWEALRYGCENGFKIFDFGRSNIHSGTHRFKAQWGAKPIPLDYKVISLNGKKHNTSVSTYRGLMGTIFSQVWKWMPYSITLWLGPKLRKYLP